MAGRLVKVLAIDGGGVRGLIPALVLAEIEARTETPCAELFDVIAGTSTGGIIALGLTVPSPDDPVRPANSAAHLVELYETEGTTIFHKGFLRELPFAEWFEEQYKTEPIRKLLREKYFGEARMSQALTDVVVPTYDLNGPAPFFFKRSYAREHPWWDYCMWQAARATSAAPTYFEPELIKADPRDPKDHDHVLVDGGVFANNPAMCAYAEALRLHGPDCDYLVVSLGTGTRQKKITMGEAEGWGKARWAKPILEVVFDGVSDTVDYQLKELCRDSPGGEPRYRRFQRDPLEYASEAMDEVDAKNLANLRRDGEELIAECSDRIDAVCALLRAPTVEADDAREVVSRGRPHRG